MSEISRRTILQLAASGMILPAIQQLADAVENDPYKDAKLVDGPPAAIQAGSFTIAVLPDTQNYSEKFPEIFLAQTRWIVEQNLSKHCGRHASGRYHEHQFKNRMGTCSGGYATTGWAGPLLYGSWESRLQCRWKRH